MAGVSRSNKELWVLISGVSVLKSQVLVGTELEKNATKIFEGISAYKKPNAQSAKILSQNKNVDGAQFNFIQKLSRFLDLDEVQCYDVFCSYILHEYKGSQKGLLSALSNERLMQNLMLQIWNFYHCERLYLLLCMKQIISYWLDENHPYQELYEQFFERLNRDSPSTVIQKVISQLEQTCNTTVPDKDTHGSLMNENQIYKWTTFNLKEQCELLQIVLLYYKDMACKSDTFLEIVTLFQKHGFGRRQHHKHFLDEASEALLATVKYLEALIILETMELEWLLKTTEKDERSYHMIEDKDMWNKIDNLLCSLGSAIEHSPVILGWMVVRFVLLNDSDKTTTNKRLAKLALKHNVFEYLHKMLKAQLFSGDSVIANLSHTVIFGLITTLLSLFELNTLGSIEHIQSVAVLLLRHSNIARDTWEQGLDAGLGILIRNAMEWFPLEFHPLMSLLTAIAASGENHEEILAFIQKLNCYTESMDAIAKTTKINPGEEENTWQLCNNHMPYTSDTIVIPTGTVGVVIREEENGGFVFQWRTKVNGWQVCLCEIYVLLQQMSHGVGQIPEAALNKIFDIANLVFNLSNTNFKIANQLCHIIDMLHSIMPRLCNLSNPPMKLLAKCIEVFSCIAEEKAVDVWKCLSQAGFMPFMTKVSSDIPKLASGIHMNVGTIGNLIAAQECVIGKYNLTLAFLLLVNKSIDTMSEKDDANFLASVLFILQEIFPFFHKWRYRQQKDREMIGQGCLNVSHKLLNLPNYSAKEGTLAQKLCVYCLLYGSAGQALLLIVGTGEDNIQATLEQQTSWFASDNSELIEMVRLSLSVLNRLLLLKSHLKIDSTETSPMELTLCSPPFHHTQPHIVLIVAHYGFHRYDPRLAALAIRLLKRFAKELSISLLACLGNDSEAIRDTYLSRLEAVAEDVRLKIALLEFLTVCVVSQPGLLEMFLNTPKQIHSTTQEINKNQLSCLQSVVEILKERKEALQFCPIELHRAAVEFLHALWLGWRNIAINILKKNVSFWSWLCDPLFEDCKTGKNIQIVAYVMKILALEFYYTSLSTNNCDAELKDVIKKLFSGTSIEYWSKTVQEVLSTTERVGNDVSINTSLSPLPSTYKDTFMLLSAWRDFLVVLAKHKAFPLSNDQKVLLVRDTMQNLLDQSSNPISAKAFNVLTELQLLLLYNWKSECIGNWKERAMTISDLLAKVSSNQDVITARSVLDVMSFATYFLQLIPKDKNDLVDDSILGEWVASICIIINSSSVNTLQMTQTDIHSVFHQLPMSCVCLLKELLNRLDSSIWLSSLLQYSTISCLVSIISLCIQIKTGPDVVTAILTFFLTLALKNESAQLLCSSDLMQEISLPLSFTYSTNVESMELQTNHVSLQMKKQNQSPWLDVYQISLNLVTVLLKTQKHFFLEDALNFVGVHLDKMFLSLMKVRLSLNPNDLDSALNTLNFVHTLSSYKQSWKLQHNTSLKSLMKCVCSVCQSSIAFLIRPNFIQHLLEHQPKSEIEDVYLEEERQRIRRLSSTEDVEKLSPQLLLIQTKLLEIVAVSLSTLHNFTPDICEILLDQSMDTSHWEPVLDGGFSTPTIDQDLPMNFGSMISCVNVCLRALTKNEQLPSPGRSVQSETSLQVDRALLLFVLENALMMLTSQALLYLVLPQPTSRDKQLIKRELGAELSSFSLSMNRYLRRGSVIHSPATSSLVSPSQTRSSQLWPSGSGSLPGSQPFIRLIISLVEKVFK